VQGRGGHINSSVWTSHLPQYLIPGGSRGVAKALADRSTLEFKIRLAFMTNAATTDPKPPRNHSNAQPGRDRSSDRPRKQGRWKPSTAFAWMTSSTGTMQIAGKLEL
jgi:hypothetical protein